MTCEPPPPDKDKVPRYGSEALIEVIYSDDSETRAIITEDARGLVRLRFESWDIGDWKDARVAFWIQTSQMAHILDSADRARTMALEDLEALNQNRKNEK